MIIVTEFFQYLFTCEQLLMSLLTTKKRHGLCVASLRVFCETFCNSVGMEVTKVSFFAPATHASTRATSQCTKKKDSENRTKRHFRKHTHTNTHKAVAASYHIYFANIPLDQPFVLLGSTSSYWPSATSLKSGFDLGASLQ